MEKKYEECFHCEVRRIRVDKPYWAVHMTTSGEVVPHDYDGEDSQGCFANGPSCRKKYPLAFRMKALE